MNEAMALIQMLGGEHASKVVAAIGVTGYAWAQLRQFIPARWLAKLPNWAIRFLETAAANRGQSRNNHFVDPQALKRDLTLK